MIKGRVQEILYVDDTEEQRYAMRRILEGAGYTVREAGTGGEALRKIHPGMLAVILDVKLPDISGYEVCRRIKADAATSAIPVLQVSASFADPALRARGLQGGADAYVAQPVEPAELLSLVGALIRSHDSERTLRFQAEISRRLGQSIEYEETLRTIAEVFSPRFADRCLVLLRATTTNPASLHAHGLTPADGQGAALAPALLHASFLVSHDSHPLLLAKGSVIPGTNGAGERAAFDTIVAPMTLGRKQLGALVFEVDGVERRYEPGNLALAQDLADRAALALQNATLYRAQQTAQAALVQSEKLAAAGRLSAAIAHEINNPLEAITNLIYLIDTSGEISPTVKGYVQEALSELSRLTHIARQSLGFYRELTGAQQFDLNESVEDTLNIYLKRFAAKKLDIERHYAPGSLELRAVKGEVRQVISNLLVNAYDALANGGRLTIETDRAAGGEGEPERVLLRVIDDGPGIPEEVLEQIFEPFFTTKQGTGTGLGLWVSQTIVEKHGGTIEVRTSMDPERHGTTFEVVLPLETEQAASV